MNEITVFTLSMYSVKFDPFFDILMTVWVQCYAKVEGLGLTSIFQKLEEIIV